MPPALVTACIGRGSGTDRDLEQCLRWVSPNVDVARPDYDPVATPIVLRLDCNDRVLASFWEALPRYLAPLLSGEVDVVELTPMHAEFEFDSMAQVELMASEFPDRFRPAGPPRAVLTRHGTDQTAPINTRRVLRADEPLIRISPRSTSNTNAHVGEADAATIFVMIASYRDPDLWPTIDDALSTAAHPGRLRFGLCVQDRIPPPTRFVDHPQIRMDVVDPLVGEGVGWARSRAQRFYAGEDFTLQIDAHSRFEPGWDVILIDELLSADAAKPILTTYPPMYRPGEAIDRSQPPNATVFKHFTDWGCVEYAPRPLDTEELSHGPIPARHFSAGFAFAPGRFVLDVPYDPEIYFMGEEVTMAARAFTHGYDLFHPARNILFHHYARHSAPKHWEDLFATEPDHNRYDHLLQRSYSRVCSLLGIDGAAMGDFGPFGLGPHRALREFEVHCGVDFRRRLVERYAIGGAPPPDPFWMPTQRAIESQAFVTSIDVRGALRTGTRRWRVKITDPIGVERAEIEVATSDIAGVLLSGRPELVVPYTSYRRGTAWELEVFDDDGHPVATEKGDLGDAPTTSTVWA